MFKVDPGFRRAMTSREERLLGTLAGVVAERAQAVVPVKTGRLRRSIRSKVLRGLRAAVAYSDVEYAPFVELGSGARAAKPYFRPALLSLKNIPGLAIRITYLAPSNTPAAEGHRERLARTLGRRR